MFAQMKRRRGVNRPCPCGGVCSCHTPKKESKLHIAIISLIFVSLLIFPGLPISLAIYIDHHPRPEQHIEVDGKDCIVKYVTDHCTSTGACRGHDVAVCDK
jgi:hypothetical protein